MESLLPQLGEKAREVTFSVLRRAIRDLQEASFKLDNEKNAAEKDFKSILEKIHFPGRPFPRTIRRPTGIARLAADWIKQLFGVPPPTDDELHFLSLRSAESWEEYLEFAADVEDDELGVLGSNARLSFPLCKLIKAAKRVVAANKKLIMFERGFISWDGIKDREWYRHLGVAPGKWLGTCKSLRA